MFIIENITDIFLPIWTLWVRCAVWLIQANPIRSVWLILRVLSKKKCGKFVKSSIFCGILNPTILSFRMYELSICHFHESWGQMLVMNLKSFPLGPRCCISIFRFCIPAWDLFKHCYSFWYLAAVMVLYSSWVFGSIRFVGGDSDERASLHLFRPFQGPVCKINSRSQSQCIAKSCPLIGLFSIAGMGMGIVGIVGMDRVS